MGRGRTLLFAASFGVFSLNFDVPTALAADAVQPVDLPEQFVVKTGPRHEIRAGVLYHDMEETESGVDLSAEYLSRFAAIDFETPVLGTRSMLRPHIGVNLNTNGETSMAYAGYTLSIDLNDYLFVEGSFGGMVHNGEDDDPSGRRLSLGCQVLFRESAAFGVHINDHWNLVGSIEHSSNGGGCVPNNGLTNAGVRLGYAF